MPKIASSLVKEMPPGGGYILRIGEAILTMRSDAGGVVMSLRVVSGSLLGLPAVTGNQPYSLTAMARKRSEVRFVAQSDFEYTLRIEPSLYPKVLQVLAEEVRAARKAFCEALGFLSDVNPTFHCFWANQSSYV